MYQFIEFKVSEFCGWPSNALESLQKPTTEERIVKMLICNGDGQLMVNPVNGNVVWGTDGSPLLSWCHQNDYKDVCNIEGALNLDSHELPLPSCEECPQYELCCDNLEGEDEEPDNTYCIAVDEVATGKSILAALAALDEGTRNEILGYEG